MALNLIQQKGMPQTKENEIEPGQRSSSHPEASRSSIGTPRALARITGLRPSFQASSRRTGKNKTHLAPFGHW